MSQVFVSYSRKNIEFATHIKNDLEQQGISCWMDNSNIPGGEEWEHAIFDGIRDTEVLVVCVSPEAVQSEWVQEELKYARKFRKRIIPIMETICLKDVQDSTHVEIQKLLDLQFIIFENRYEIGLRQLVSAIRIRDVNFALNEIYEQSGQPDFKATIQRHITSASSIVLSGIGLNVLGDPQFAREVMARAAQEDCVLDIYLANPLHPSVQTRLVEEETGDMPPPVGKDGLLGRLRAFLKIWDSLGQPERVRINLINHYPTFAYLIIDDEYFFYPYGYAELGNFSPVLHFSGNNSKSRYFKSFIDRHHQRIQKTALATRMTWQLLTDPHKLDAQELQAIAIYYVPPSSSSLYQFGTNILGYDLRETDYVSSGWADYVGAARDFGFHMTICDVLYFPTETEVAMIEAELTMLLQEFRPFRLSNLQLTHTFPDEHSISITLQDESGSLEALHSELVQKVYRRAVGSNYSFGIARLNRDRNYDRNHMMVNRYNAPYILNSFRPHFTLLTQIPEQERLAIYTRLGEEFAKQTDNFFIELENIAIMHQPDKNGAWQIKKEIPIGS